MDTTKRRLKDLMRKKHITVDTLAKIAGKSRATIYRYISGDIENMPMDTLAKIADALGANPGYILGWVDDPTPIILQEGEGLIPSIEPGSKAYDHFKKYSALTPEQKDAIDTMIDMFIAKNKSK